MIVVGLVAECNKSVIILNYQLSFIHYQYIMQKILPYMIPLPAIITLFPASSLPGDVDWAHLSYKDNCAPPCDRST